MWIVNAYMWMGCYSAIIKGISNITFISLNTKSYCTFHYMDNWYWTARVKALKKEAGFSHSRLANSRGKKLLTLKMMSTHDADRRQTRVRRHRRHASAYVILACCTSVTVFKQVVKVIWHKVASPPLMDGSIVFARLCPCTRPSNTWFHGPTRLSISNVISIGSAVFAQLMAESPYGLQWDAPPPQSCSFAMGDLDPHLKHGSLDTPKSTPQTTSRSVQLILQGSQ